MNNENSKINEQNIDNTQNIKLEQLEQIKVEEPKIEEVKIEQNSPSENKDESKVKIRDILKERFNKNMPALKRIIPYIIVGVICFGAGVGVDRLAVRGRVDKNLRNRPAMQQDMRKNLENGQTKGAVNNQMNKGQRNSK